jgi:hypothetical protein
MNQEQLEVYNDKLIIAIKKLISAIENDNLSWKEIIDNEDKAISYANKVLKEYSN